MIAGDADAGGGAGDYADDEEGLTLVPAPGKSRAGSSAPARHTAGIKLLPRARVPRGARAEEPGGLRGRGPEDPASQIAYMPPPPVRR